MENNGTLSRHFWLTQGMGRTRGVNINAALRAGLLARADYAEAIAMCCECGNANHCVAWMAQQAAVADALPVYCAVAPMLERLKALD